VLSALLSGKRGTTEHHITNNKDAGALARIAPVGLIGPVKPFELGSNVAALTHGHPTAYLAAGYFVILLVAIMKGASLDSALNEAETELRTNRMVTRSACARSPRHAT
jgi:ADP-ribosylglycohydrolase